MFESLGPAVLGSLATEDRKADFLPYLSWEAQWGWISLPEGHPELGDVLGRGMSSGSRPQRSGHGGAGQRRCRAEFPVRKQVQRGA